MRRATLALLVVAVAALAACTDLRDFRGQWQGARVGDTPVIDVGVAADARATLAIDALDPHGLHGTLSVDRLVAGADLASLPGAEADMAGLTFAGSPLRVYLAFVDTSDGGGQALAVVALFEDRRIELRLLRGGTAPLYGVFALAETEPAGPAHP